MQEETTVVLRSQWNALMRELDIENNLCRLRGVNRLDTIRNRIRRRRYQQSVKRVLTQKGRGTGRANIHRLIA